MKVEPFEAAYIILVTLALLVGAYNSYEHEKRIKQLELNQKISEILKQVEKK
jgi:hypothetical protein